MQRGAGKNGRLVLGFEMLDNFVVPRFAKNALKALMSSEISEVAPHTFSIHFADGAVSTVSATPFATSELDAHFVEGGPLFEMTTQLIAPPRPMGYNRQINLGARS